MDGRSKYYFLNSLFVEPTNTCNLNCVGCRRNIHGKSTMSLDMYKAIYTKLKNVTSNMSFFWQGEPTLVKHLPDMVEFTRCMDRYTYVSTNTATKYLHNYDYVNHLLKYLDRLVVCIDGYNQETISKYRVGTDFETVIKNLETIVSIDETNCKKEMAVLMFQWNEGHEDIYIEIAENYNMTNLYFIQPIILGKTKLNNKEAKQWMARDEKYQRYKKVGNTWIHKTRRIKNCEPVCIIGVDGELYPCCYDWEKRHSLGNILNDSFDKIAYNYATLVKRISLNQTDFCKNCFCPQDGYIHKVELC